MNREVENEVKCPNCGGATEDGCLFGNTNFPIARDGLQWFSGEPTAWKNLTQLGEPIGEFDALKGSFVRGNRCIKCRTIFFRY